MDAGVITSNYAVVEQACALSLPVIVIHLSLCAQGYGFCEFTDGAVVPGVIKSLHNSLVEGRKITVKRADEDSAPSSASS